MPMIWLNRKEERMTNRSDSLSKSGEAADSNFSDEPADCMYTKCRLENHWIEIQVVDEDGFPASNVAYWIKLPDGEEQEGKLDEDGFIRFEGIPGGYCQVRIQDEDESDWYSPPRQSSIPKADGVNWIEIELTDETGEAIGGQPYQLTLPTGVVRKGTLDENGFAIEKNLPSQACTLVFPDIDADDFR